MPLPPAQESFVPPSASSAPATPIRTRVREAIERAWQDAVASGALPAIEDPGQAPAVEVERPANPEHGDFATNLALRLARPLRQNPLRIAQALADALGSATGSDSVIASAAAAPPGFVNIRLADGALTDTIDGILRDPDAWGRVPPVNPRSVNIEFVSANPTGPLTVGNARGAFVGDLLARVLEAGGQTVTREYYFNDSGGQITNLGASIAALVRGEPVPKDGYRGAYVEDLVAALPDELRAAAAAGTTADDAIGTWAGRRIREGIERSLANLGVRFDVWTTEASLFEDGWVERAVQRLREHGDVFEQDGAVWFRSTAYGDDLDRVIFRSDGRPTYFAADIGYVTQKFSRHFDHLIYVWGIDHAGTVARVRGAAEAMGFDRAHVQMLLMGWVHFVRPWEPGDPEKDVRVVGNRKMTKVGMSKREGTFDTLDDLLETVGVDAARWYFASRSVNVDIDFDFGHLRQLRELVERRRNRERVEGEDNKGVDLGVYYVQYAHARMASILRKAADLSLKPASDIGELAAGSPDAALGLVIVRFPEVIEDAVRAEETHGIAHFTTELATQVQAFYRDARVIDPAQPDLSARRLALVQATKTTLAKALALLGISAPESM
jgi:arginyl-tRNA synthetase